MANTSVSGNAPQTTSQHDSSLSPAKKGGSSGFSVMGAGGDGLNEAYSDSISFAQILLTLMVTNMTKILNAITKRGVTISEDAQKDLNGILAEISKNAKDKDKLQYWQTLYTTEHDYWNNEQTQNGSQRDQFTQGISSLNQQISNFFQGISSLNNIYSNLSRLIG